MANSVIPKIVPILYYDQNMNTFQIVVKKKNVPGALSNFLSVLAESVDVINSLDCAERDFGVWIGFVKDKGDNVTADRLKMIIDSSPNTLSCTVRRNVNGFLIDTLTFPISLLDGDREIVIGAEFFRDMMRSLRTEFNTAANVFLYKEGMAFGRSAEEQNMKRFGREKILSTFSYFQGSLYSAFGWARAEVVHVDVSRHSATIRLYENFECPVGEGQDAYSHFLRGFINGTFSVIMGVGTSTKEVMCVAKGNKYCEFLISEEA